MKKALISGITGQDGSYLAELLLQKGYEVHGILRRSSSFNTGRIEHLYFDEWVRDMKQKRTINLHYGDMTDSSSLIRIIQQVQPDEIYNLAAQSHVKVSFDVPEYTAEADAIGTLRMLEAVRILGLEKKTRIYQASTSELFGKVQEVPQHISAVCLHWDLVVFLVNAPDLRFVTFTTRIMVVFVRLRLLKVRISV